MISFFKKNYCEKYADDAYKLVIPGALRVLNIFISSYSQQNDVNLSILHSMCIHLSQNHIQHSEAM